MWIIESVCDLEEEEGGVCRMVFMEWKAYYWIFAPPKFGIDCDNCTCRRADRMGGVIDSTKRDALHTDNYLSRTFVCPGLLT